MIRRLLLAACLALGFSPAWAAPALWDNANGYFTLSGADLIATRDVAPTNTYLSLRSTTARRGGKLYFEIVVGGYADNQWMAGIANGSFNFGRLGVEAVGDQDSFGAGHSTGGGFDGYFYFNNAPTADRWTLTAPVNGDVIGFAIDATRGLIWVNKNNGAWNEASGGTQDPATAQGGFAVSGLTTTQIYIAFCGQNNGTAQVGTLRASAASIAASPPSGFTVWDDAVDPPQAYVDGFDYGFGTGTSVVTNGLNTTFANDRILVFTYSHDAGVTSVTAPGVPGGFTLRKSVSGGSATEWIGVAPLPLVGEIVTANLNGSSPVSIIAVATHGAFSRALPFFDPEGTLPVSAGPTSGTGCHLQITTDNPQALLFYACGTKGPLAGIAIPTGWELVVNTEFPDSLLMVAVRLVGDAQTALDVNPATADDHENISIGDAVNGAGGAGVIPFAPLTGFR